MKTRWNLCDVGLPRAKVESKLRILPTHMKDPDIPILKEAKAEYAKLQRKSSETSLSRSDSQRSQFIRRDILGI